MFLSLRLINTKRPLSGFITKHIIYYPTPISINYAWSFGSLVGIFFALQIITGAFLAMHYTPHVDLAFQSVEHIMTDVNYGWLFRYMHANGASFIFILMYVHIARAMYYRLYTGKRQFLWWSGIFIFFLMMATAFIGYVLPWGQMSFWGATVITSLVTAIPFIGENIAFWLWGGFSVGNATLVRFFSLHYLVPFLITAIIFTHLALLHNVGSSNPLQHATADKKPFHPYFTIKDSFILSVALTIFFIIVFFYPNTLGHPDNFIPANPLVTPAHIVPEWYFTPFYAILRACPNKLGGVISMLCAILVLFILPFFKITPNSMPTNSTYLYPITYWLFISNFMILMFLGGQPATAPFVLSSKFFTLTYFWYLLFNIPLLNFINHATNTLVENEKLPVVVRKEPIVIRKEKKSEFKPRVKLTEINGTTIKDKDDNFDYAKLGFMKTKKIPFDVIKPFIPKKPFSTL
jgi:quinol-cytochrome oxidoreductase complex cytochrome b subunit